MKKILLTLNFFFVTAPVLSQVPIDPLKLPDSEAGSYVYTLGIGYSPDGQRKEFLDFFDGNYLNITETNNTFNFLISASYSFNKHIAIYGNISPFLSIEEKKTDFIDTLTTTRNTNTDVTGGLSLEYRFAPDAVLDPRLSVGVSYPFGVNVQTSATLLKDPVILLGSLGYAKSLDNNGEDTLVFGLGTGFIANEHINFSATANHIVPLENSSFSTTIISFRTGYNLDQAGKSEIGFKTILSFNSRETKVGFSLEYGGRGRLGQVNTDAEIDNNESEKKPQDSTPSESPSNSQKPLPTQSSNNNSNPSVSNNNSVVLTPNNSDKNKTLEESIQELYRLIEAKDRQIEQLQQQINSLEEKLNKQEK